MAMTDVLDRLADKFTVGDDCWEWTATRHGAGYGLFWNVETKSYDRAHRVVYELMVGPIPDGLVLDHLCRNRGCVRPSHCEPVSIGENVRRGTARNTKVTHCPQGHPYDETNTYIEPSTGARRCQVCRLATLRRYREKASR
jgi:hypothetical protein